MDHAKVRAEYVHFRIGALALVEERGLGIVDLIALVRVSNHDDVARVVADAVNKVPGVMETETHIAFRTYSQHDLEAAFSLGLD